MEIIYRSGKFCIRGNAQDKVGKSGESLEYVIAALRLVAGDVGTGQCISRTPETESYVREMANRFGITIHCEGVYRKAEVYLQVESSSKRSDRLATCEQRNYPLDNINQEVYLELLHLKDTRMTSSEELYRVVIKEYKSSNGHWEITSESITPNINAQSWAKKKGLKV